ncbi:hypothetical protein [Mangrovibrevibacter kandeliae]|uniref:hypothetical protein n=1 Tax=Mangrovibrevibacter kandeliae TaxID=2968473 RepID=UPI0021173357|nr:hypothetical protein [Aurantimonas sp. CSK15Z-1]MCQ8781243.1 hypothetical protein [Aurantimonas sp. CSK15Z-1]
MSKLSFRSDGKANMPTILALIGQPGCNGAAMDVTGARGILAATDEPRVGHPGLTIGVSAIGVDECRVELEDAPLRHPATLGRLETSRQHLASVFCPTRPSLRRARP